MLSWCLGPAQPQDGGTVAWEQQQLISHCSCEEHNVRAADVEEARTDLGRDGQDITAWAL